MVQNISETIKVPASFLVDGLKELSEDVKKRLLAYAAMKDGDDKAKEGSLLVEALPEKMKKELESIGAKLPTEVVSLTMKLGDMLFNLYAFNVKPVQAPLAIKRHERILLELSELFSREDLDIPGYVVRALQPIMTDPDKWNSSQFSAFVMIADQPKYIGLTAMGASCFNTLLNAAVEVVDIPAE